MCECHFAAKDFMCSTDNHVKQHKRLRHDAVPSIFSAEHLVAFDVSQCALLIIKLQLSLITSVKLQHS